MTGLNGGGDGLLAGREQAASPAPGSASWPGGVGPHLASSLGSGQAFRALSRSDSSRGRAAGPLWARRVLQQPGPWPAKGRGRFHRAGHTVPHDPSAPQELQQTVACREQSARHAPVQPLWTPKLELRIVSICHKVLLLFKPLNHLKMEILFSAGGSHQNRRQADRAVARFSICSRGSLPASRPHW